MYEPTPEVIARAFDLGRPCGELVHVRSGDTDTWRLETEKGSFFVKGYRETTGGQFTAGGLYEQLEVAMAFERRALEMGNVDMAEPIPPANPLLGWTTSIHERLFRVYPWIEHRAVRPDDDIADWLGRTMARIHQLAPLGQAGLPDWWRGSIWPCTTWEERFAEADRQAKPWSKLGRERLSFILELSARIEALCEVAPDCVTTHGDFKAHNMLMAPTGPLLVDWDSVRVDSAALEAGRVAYIFGAAELEPIRRVLSAYADAGGEFGWAGQDLYLSVARHDLHGLCGRMLVSLGQHPITWWMGDSQTVERDITAMLHDLPDRVAHLGYLADNS